ncbi:hypothetical protein P9112_002238 [Eukaryota sp. TZLM1-RC]
MTEVLIVKKSCPGCASGVLAVNVSSLITQVFFWNRILNHTCYTNNLLIERDLLQTLGLRTEHGFNINLDREHRTILNAECEFDNRICQPIRFIEELSNKSDLANDFGHFTFRHNLDKLGCRICLDDIRDEERPVVLLEKYRDVFSELPHPDGIDCQPMTISFYDESKVVKWKPRRLNPEKQRVAEEIFNELIRNGFAVPAKSQFSSPICLVIYSDHRKPRLTGRKVLPIAFFSKLLSTSQKTWSVLQKEFSLENYLISRKLTIFTDHRNLAYLISAPEKNRIVKRWLPILSEFNYDVVHTAGEENYWADMLSRLVDTKPKTPRVQQVRNLAPHSVEEQLPHLNLLTRVNLLRDDITQPSTIELPTINSLSALKEAVEDTKFDLFDT